MLHRAILGTLAGLILMGNGMAATHQVMQLGFTFVPDDLTIAVGDTVEWVWSSGFHTVTQGLDDLNPPVGAKLFDGPLDLANSTFTFTFMEAGDVDYYCRPHLIFDMIGIIRVQSVTPAPDPDFFSWSRVKTLYR